MNSPLQTFSLAVHDGNNCFHEEAIKAASYRAACAALAFRTQRYPYPIVIAHNARGGVWRKYYRGEVIASCEGLEL